MSITKTECYRLQPGTFVAENPLKWTYKIIHTRAETTTESVSTSIDFAEFGITNPLIARTLIALRETSVLSSPEDFMSLLSHYATSQQDISWQHIQTSGPITDIFVNAAAYSAFQKEETPDIPMLQDRMKAVAIQGFFTGAVLKKIFPKEAENIGLFRFSLFDYLDSIVKVTEGDSMKSADAYSLINTFVDFYSDLRHITLGLARHFFKTVPNLGDYSYDGLLSLVKQTLPIDNRQMQKIIGDIREYVTAHRDLFTVTQDDPSVVYPEAEDIYGFFCAETRSGISFISHFDHLEAATYRRIHGADSPRFFDERGKPYQEVIVTQRPDYDQDLQHEQYARQVIRLPMGSGQYITLMNLGKCPFFQIGQEFVPPQSAEVI